MLLILFASMMSRSQEFTLIHDGLTRSYKLHLPSDYDQDSLYPLVVNMHGMGSNAIEQEFYSEFDNVADTGRFIVVYPNGINSVWNISSEEGTDDVGFVSCLIDTINTQYSIDLMRVYATGMSMGGFMSYRLACELSGRIAAIGSVAGLQAYYPCAPERPVPVVQFHGTADEVVPYIGVSTTINNWLNYNQCPDTATITYLPDIDTTDFSTVTTYNYGPCNNLSEVILYSIINGEHTWPGSQIYIGITNQDIKASNEIWNFFKKYTLAGPLGFNNNPGQQEMSCIIYPNPVDDFASVEIPSCIHGPYMLKILSFDGREVLKTGYFNDNQININFSPFPQGLYFALLLTNSGESISKIIIK